MNRQAVSSSNLRSVGYDAQSATLEIEFQSGGIYQYLSVPVTTRPHTSVHQCARKAPLSQRSHFNQLRTLDKRHLGRYVARLTNVQMDDVDAALKLSLGFDPV